jgi:hypothetical protein
MVLLGVLLAIIGIMGDLFESLLKRASGIKDSSSLIPGHGGILDRIDALLFVFPAYAIFLRLQRTVEPMAAAPMRLAILGSTGSIGHSALAVVDAHADRLQVIGLAAGTSARPMALQVERYRPRAVVMATDAACDTLRAQLPDRAGRSPRPVRRRPAGARRSGHARRRRHRAVRVVRHRRARGGRSRRSAPASASRSPTRKCW